MRGNRNLFKLHTNQTANEPAAIDINPVHIAHINDRPQLKRNNPGAIPMFQILHMAHV